MNHINGHVTQRALCGGKPCVHCHSTVTGLVGISRNNLTVLTLTNFATLSISVVVLTHSTNCHLSYDQELHQDVHRLIVL